MSDVMMLVNVVEEEEARVAIVENGRLEEFYLERASGENIVGNIHKGVVVGITPSIEAAFVDFGHKRHGFLHVSDVRPPKGEEGGDEAGGRRRRGNIKKLLRLGDEVLVQVTKEGIGDKGPALTTYLSLPGRYLVLMPGSALRGVSRRIEQEDERRRLREAVAHLSAPQDIGVIARTAGLGTSEAEMERDLDYLLRLWRTIQGRAEHAKGPALLYQESDHVIRVIRDVFRDDIRRILVDSPAVHEKISGFLREVMPRHVRKVKLYTEDEPLFHHYGVEAELEKINSRRVSLPCGGSIVLDQTEALVAIDVNSGQFKGKPDAEESALEIDLEAADEIARQVRLRDLGGVIVMDFIDMEDREHRIQVEKALKAALKRDKARIRVLRMSGFCIVQMTRQRRRPSFRQATYVECPTCGGSGHVKSPETMALEMIRNVQMGLNRKEVARVEVDVNPKVASYLNNNMRARLSGLEEEARKQVMVHANPNRRPDEEEITFLKDDGTHVKI